MMNYRFYYQQEQPGLICADRALETAEQHPENDFYGQASVLKRYAGLREDYSLPLVIEHGLRRDGRIWSVDRDAIFSTLLVASKARRDDIQKLTDKRVIPIGSCFFYAKQIVDEQTGASAANDNRSGTVVFPVHSTHWISAQFDNETFADELRKLPDAMQPVVVCIYWKDYLKGSHEVYQRRGMQVISAGHMFDRDFLLRFYDICRQFKFAVGNAIGTHLFYAVNSGCSFAHLPGFPARYEIPEEQRMHCSQGEKYEASINNLQQLFAEIRPRPTRSQLAEVERIAGNHSVRGRAEMRSLIAGAERRDCFRPTWSTINTGEKVFLPPRFARNVPKPLRILFKTKRSITKRLPGIRSNKAA